MMRSTVLVFPPMGKNILTKPGNDKAKLWNAQSGMLIAFFKGERIQSAGFSPDGKKVVTASMDGIVKIWDAPPAVQKS